MSTPVSVEEEPDPARRQIHHRVPTDQLTEQMQQLCQLQNEQMSQYTFPGDLKKQEQEDKTTSVLSRILSTETTVTDSHGNRTRTQQKQNAARTNSPATLLQRSPSHENFPDSFVVGKGTLLFTSESLNKQQSRVKAQQTQPFSPDTSSLNSSQIAGSNNNVNGNNNGARDQCLQEQLPKLLDIPKQSEEKNNTNHEASMFAKSSTHTANLDLASYGACQEETNLVSGAQQKLSASPRQQQQQQQQQFAGEEYHGMHEHAFYYGHPDYHDPYAPSDIGGNSRSNLCRSAVNAIGSCFRSDSPGARSFCYGAIDGMLTGSGIVAAFCGLKVLSCESPFDVGAFCVCFTAAACFSDSLCMAVGHMWTSTQLAIQHKKERDTAGQYFRQHKADAKGQLVDMLLARGVLKIDAMSIADTLEGYPDLFVSTLIGDSLLGPHQGGGGQQQQNHSKVSHTPLPAPLLEEGTTLPQEQQQQQHHSVISPISSSFWSKIGGVARTNVYPSFEKVFYADTEDSETLLKHDVFHETIIEAVFMVLGFSLAAIVPALIYLFRLGTLVTVSSAETTKSIAVGGFGVTAQYHQVSSSSHHDSFVVTLTACLMWLLGVWKSRFSDSNWMIFGIETVAVFFLCIFVAYGLGAALSIFLPEFLLQIAETEAASLFGDSADGAANNTVATGLIPPGE